MAELALPALIISTATAATGQVMAGQERANAAAFEGQQYRIQQQQYETAAARDEATRREDMRSSIDTIAAIRAGRGVGQGSPTETAILDDITRRGESDIQTNRANLLTRADQSRMASDMSSRRARMALIAGDLGAVSTISSAAFRYGRGGGSVPTAMTG